MQLNATPERKQLNLALLQRLLHQEPVDFRDITLAIDCKTQLRFRVGTLTSVFNKGKFHGT